MKLFLLPLILFCSLYTGAQPVLVQDIMPGVFSSDPTRLTVYNNQLYFFAKDGVKGNELWRYNGNSAQMVHDIYNGSTDCAPSPANRKMTELNYKLYFPADNGVAGLELFSYDGVNPPVMVSDIAGGQNGSKIDEIVALDGKLYFDANNGTNGEEIWDYNPATGQATQLSFINSGNGSAPRHLTVFNNKLYFTAYTPATGRELYEYNPADGLVKLIMDIHPGSPDSDPEGFNSIPGKLFFTAETQDYGRELYLYDGISVQRLTDFSPGYGSGFDGYRHNASMVALFGNEIFFAGDDGSSGSRKLYKYDIITGNTALVSPVEEASGFIYYANKIFFTAAVGTTGFELYVYDGQTVNIVADINLTNVSIPPGNLAIYNNSLYFTIYGSTGNELYKYTDAAAGITDKVSANGVTVYPNPAGNNLFFKLDLKQAETLNIQLADAMGRTVYNHRENYTAGVRTVPVSVAAYPQGVYIYHITNADGQTFATGRVVKL